MLLRNAATDAIGVERIARAATDQTVDELCRRPRRDVHVIGRAQHAVGALQDALPVGAIGVGTTAQRKAKGIESIAGRCLERQVADRELRAIAIDIEAEMHPVAKLIGIGGAEHGSGISLPQPGREAGDDALGGTERADEGLIEGRGVRIAVRCQAVCLRIDRVGHPLVPTGRAESVRRQSRRHLQNRGGSRRAREEQRKTQRGCGS